LLSVSPTATDDNSAFLLRGPSCFLSSSVGFVKYRHVDTGHQLAVIIHDLPGNNSGTHEAKQHITRFLVLDQRQYGASSSRLFSLAL
jgi:hypothetical protein